MKVRDCFISTAWSSSLPYGIMNIIIIFNSVLKSFPQGRKTLDQISVRTRHGESLKSRSLATRGSEVIWEDLLTENECMI